MLTAGGLRGRMHKVLIAVVAAAGLAFLPQAASAYVLRNTESCHPGQKWDTSRPVKVRVLADSVHAYLEWWNTSLSLSDLTRLDRDIDAVIELYNSVPGTSLVLERGEPILGDRNLDGPDVDNFGGQTIVIGFTDNLAAGSPSAEAWTSPNSSDGCTTTRMHILLRRKMNWTLGPPDTTDEDGRSFKTAAQPRQPSLPSPITFLGVLTHEMGHALGLVHPDHDYSVMAQSFRTWFRGKDHILRTQLLPDDIAGLQALYGASKGDMPLDISVSNTWFKSAKAQSHTGCAKQIADVDAAAEAVSKATGLPVPSDFPADVINKGDFLDLFQALDRAQDALHVCEDEKNAVQVENCRISSRGDSWTGKLTGRFAFCGVNKASGSALPKISDRICPGKDVQLRYTLNNHTGPLDVLVKSEAWFSLDTKLNVRDGIDIQSPDVREFAIGAGTSASVDQFFRLPAAAPDGETFFVFVRAVPFDPRTGANLLGTESDQWNNAIMVRSSIKVDSSVCH